MLRAELEDPPKVFFDVTSDACLADVDRAGIGGFCHGLFWFYEVPEDVRPYLTIPVLEFLAVGCGLLTFFQYLRGASRTGPHGANVRILLRTDALTSALAKSSEAQGGQPPYAASTDRQPESLSTSRRRAMVGPMKTSCCHSTISEWPSSNRPDFPPASPCGNREFWADVPHRNRDHQTYGAVRRVHSFFPYNVTDARRWVLCAARYVFLQRTFKPREDRVGALGGQYGRRSTPRQLRCHRPTPRQLRV